MNEHNPLVRMLVAMVLVAAGIRLVYELLLPVLPVLVVGIAVIVIWRLVRWYRERW